jgi:hypothetical protein
MKNCRTISKNKLFTFKEQRSSLTLENIDQVESIKIHVDGCEIDDDDIKCDFMHLAKNIEMYIELKGQDLSHAMLQIERTMKMLSSNLQKQAKISYIICTRSPLSSTEIQNYDRQFRIKYNSKLFIKSSPYKDTY